MRTTSTRTHADIVKEAAAELDMPASHVRRVVEHYAVVLRDAVWHQGRVHLPHFGVFAVRKRRRRRIVNPPDIGGEQYLPAHEAVAFRASKNWRRR